MALRVEDHVRKNGFDEVWAGAEVKGQRKSS
jgi:hypothetical protein